VQAVIVVRRGSRELQVGSSLQLAISKRTVSDKPLVNHALRPNLRSSFGGLLRWVETWPSSDMELGSCPEGTSAERPTSPIKGFQHIDIHQDTLYLEVHDFPFQSKYSEKTGGWKDLQFIQCGG
jgi:hypothetical protein